ncbi:LytR C-terminal domain-containing protein [Dermacoccus abyssi]|uniref:LytR C-terminal domain-containing protein n=1 Tax=Dermacoccus abyssi TaxID=322596 RepID=UPI002AD4E3FF|nr:LytR C-terminal domain-containing protein [Dermacoccus abyssi]
MSYVRDNGLERARRRRERRSLAILTLCALLVIGSVVFAATFMSQPSKPKAGECPSGTTTSLPPQATFPVNVYNAGGPKGAAGDAADALRTYEFNVGTVSNDPYKKKISDVGEIRFGPGGAHNAKKYVEPRVPGARLVQDGRDGAGVDVVVGPQFPTLEKAAEKPSASPSCS